jgi:3-methyladenine DNA glycosylase AlkD
MPFDVTAEATWFRSRLEALAARPVWGETKIHLRIAIPNIRQLVADRRNLIDAADDEDVGALADALWGGVTYDEMALAIALLRVRPSLVDPDRIDRWRVDLDGWGTTDDLAGAVRPWVTEDPEYALAVLEHLAGESHAWSRRLALLATVGLARAGTHTDRILQMVASVLDDVRPTIQRAVSTVLREAGTSDPEPVLVFVEEHTDRLPARTRLEVRNKIRTGRKDGRSERRTQALRGRIERARKKASDGKARRPPGRRKRDG